MTLLSDVLAADDRFDHEAVIDRFPWFLERGLDCVISPDADGQLCALLLTNLLGWRVRGFYDGKAMVIDRRVGAKDCVFVDVEVFRRDVRSFGNHMLLFNANRKPPGWVDQLNQCFAINEWRGHDRRVFRRKYPFASIHFLLRILGHRHSIELPPSAAGPLLHADGTYKLLLQYTENAWDWLRYMGVSDADNPLHALFHGDDLTIYSVMTRMLEFWRRRDETSRTGHRGDRIAITERGGDGSVTNLVSQSSGQDELWAYASDARERNEAFLTVLGDLTGWPYRSDAWSWKNWRLHEFAKGIHTEVTNLKAYDGIVEQLPLSWAITAVNRCEYTLESRGRPSPFR